VNGGRGFERRAADGQEPGRGGGAVGGIEDVQPGGLHDGGSDAVGGGAGEAQIVPEGLGVVGLQRPDLGLGIPGDDGETGESGDHAGGGRRVGVGDVRNHRAGLGGEQPEAPQRVLVVGRERRGVDYGGVRELLAHAAEQLERVLRLAPLDARTLGGAFVGARGCSFEDLEIPQR